MDVAAVVVVDVEIVVALLSTDKVVIELLLPFISVIGK